VTNDRSTHRCCNARGFLRTLVGLACALALASCRDAPPKDEPASAPAPASTPGLPPLAGFFADKLDEPGPYEAPRQSADFAADAPHMLVLELDKPIAEIESFSWTGGSVATLRSVIARLTKSAQDANVQGVVLRASDLDIGTARATELKAALQRFKGDGARKVLCHTERIADAGYLVLTACDRIAIAPLGEVAIPGPSATPIHVKGLLDRFGITADFLHVGAFKGAAEPLTREAPSPEMRKTLEAIVERSYRTQIEAIVAARKLSEADAIARIDQALFVGEQAVQAGLVDEIATWEAFVGGTGLPWTVARGDKKLADFGALQRFLGMLPPERPSEPHVALVYAVGTIVDGAGTGILGAREQIASRTLVPALRALASDENVKAVVVRVDSGGGSALASEQIWAAMSELAAQKPVIVSMASVAASGGYYISAPAQKIFAEPDTLTGSIGVVGGKIVVRDALEKLGIQTYDVHRGARARIWSAVSTWDEGERAAVRNLMERTYATFVDRVAAGRKLGRDQVLALAEGRVWTGSDARERGLVDAIGGLDDALTEAATQAGVEPGGPLSVYPPEPTLRDILTSFGTVSVGGEAGAFAALLSDPMLVGLAGAALEGDASRADARFARGLRRMLVTIAALQRAHVWALSPSYSLPRAM